MTGLSQTLPYLLLISGTILVVAEALIPGAHFIVLGVALLATGSVSALTPLGGSLIGVGIVFIVSSAVTFLGYQRLSLFGSEQGQTSDSQSLEGEVGAAMERVTESNGRVNLPAASGFDTEFEARTNGEEIEAGTEVVVTDGGGGSILTVEPADRDD